MAVESQVRRIEVSIKSDGDRSLKTIAKGFSEVNKSIKDSTSVMSSFRNAFLALKGLSFAGIGVREIVQTADAMQKLGDRLSITEGGAIGASARLRDLTGVANDNYTAVEDIAQIYSRLNLALSDAGVSSRDLVAITDTLQKTFRLSGATSAEATASVVQLSQGLASGQLRGQELRSVLEQNAVIGKILAKELGVARGELIKIAEKRGGISAVEVIGALNKNMGELNEQAKQLKPTIQEALIKNFNDLKLKMSDLNKEFGLTEKIISGLDFVFKNLDIVAVIAGAAVAWKAYSISVGLAVTANTAFTASMIALASSPLIGFLVKASVAIVGFVASIASIPLAVAGAVTAFVLAFATMSDFRQSVLDATESVWEFFTIGSRTPDFQKTFYDQKNAMEKTASAALQLERNYGMLEIKTSKVEKEFNKLFEATISGETSLGPIEKLFDKVGQTAIRTSGGVFDFKKSLAELNNQFTSKSIGLEEYNKKLKELRILDLKKDMSEGTIVADEYNKRLKEIEFGKLKNNVKDFQFDLRELNKEFGESGSVYFYSRALDEIELKRLSADFKEGKTNLLDFNSALNAKRIEEYNREFSTGTMSFQTYREGIRDIKIDELGAKFKAGKIEAAEFNDEMTKLSEKFNPSSALFTGINNYVNSAGTISQNVANVVTQTFGHLEDSMVQFTETGKFNFREFTKAVLDDLNRIIIRSLIIRPLAEGILGAISGGGTAAQNATNAKYSTTNASAFDGPVAAKGAAFDGARANFFASGGVVNGATAFGYGGGKLGIMGEAGPEAILPLKRGANGDLGVKAAPSNVVVNVINQSGAETEQRESTNANGDRVIDILIVNKVKEGFANGAFDRQMSQQYGLRRRGA